MRVMAARGLVFNQRVIISRPRGASRTNGPKKDLVISMREKGLRSGDID